MATWQLFVDETGDFRSTGSALAVGGWLLEGYASPQLSEALKRSLERIFTGVAYPQHAAHHNSPSSLLFEPIRSGGVDRFAPRFAARVVRALEVVRDETTPDLVALRESMRTAPNVRAVSIATLRAADAWLGRRSRAAFAALREESDSQRAELCSFLEKQLAPTLARRQAVVAAWKHSRTSALATDTLGDADYCELFETMLERALALVAERDADAKLWVHVASRPSGAGGAPALADAKRSAKLYPLLRRASRPPALVDLADQHYDANVHPGIVVADFMVNRVRHALSAPQGWADVESVVRARTGIEATSRCSLVRRSAPLPSICGTLQDRAAVRAASEGADMPILSAPTWARQQASMWVDAIREDG